MTVKISGKGPAQADIVIVGFDPSNLMVGVPFAPNQKRLIAQLLMENGYTARQVYFTTVCKSMPPRGDISAWITDKKRIGVANDWPCINGRYASPEVQNGLLELYEEVASRKPRVIVGLGNEALWAFTGEWGVTDWRGSQMCLSSEIVGESLQGVPFIPSLCPSSVIKQWSLRPQMAQDFSVRIPAALKGAQEPKWDFNIAPTVTEVFEFLDEMVAQGSAAIDIETSRERIVCVGIALSPTRAMCIPFISESYGAYWRSIEYYDVLQALKQALSKIRIIGQNFNYDATYFKADFNVELQVAHDTKIAQNVLFPGMPANLGFLSSMYCKWHCYWKDDARDWQNLKDFDALFKYNCRDVCATYEIAEAQDTKIKTAGLNAQFQERMRYNGYVWRMQERGVIRGPSATMALENEVEEALQARAQIVNDAAGCVVNIASPVQVGKVLYEHFQCRRPLRAGGPTSDEALQQVAEWHPETKAFCQAVMEWRSLSSVRNNFLHASLDPDGQLRSSFLTTGTETYRLTSSKNNFRRGTNLLNISAGGKKFRGMPNFRRAIIPPPGYTIFDCDLARADLQVVVWEAEDEDLKQKLREGVDIHMENAKDIFGPDATAVQRELGKTFVHLTNYGGGARTCAVSCGVTVHEADMAQRRWFAAHPGIKHWHNRVQAELETSRTVRNKFGYRCVAFGRIDQKALRDALAWIPQSTIAILASKIHMRMEDEAKVHVLLQMYDSVMGLYPTDQEAEVLPIMHKATLVAVPYRDPLYIDMGLKTSRVSWGDCAKRDDKHPDGYVKWGTQ